MALTKKKWRRLKKRYARSPHVHVLDTIRVDAAKGALARLRGRIQDAMFWEGHVDSFTKEAEKLGKADAAYSAEEAGRRIAQRLYDKERK